MEQLHEERISCPYCNEPMVVLIDPQDRGQEYIEDCQVCCRPINFAVSTGFSGELSVCVSAENET
jgi:transcription elongation factor Elf1